MPQGMSGMAEGNALQVGLHRECRIGHAQDFEFEQEQVASGVTEAA